MLALCYLFSVSAFCFILLLVFLAPRLLAPAAVLATDPVAVLIVAAAIALVCCYVTLLLLLLHAFVLSNYKLSRGHPSIQNLFPVNDFAHAPPLTYLKKVLSYFLFCLGEVNKKNESTSFR